MGESSTPGSKLTMSRYLATGGPFRSTGSGARSLDADTLGTEPPPVSRHRPPDRLARPQGVTETPVSSSLRSQSSPASVSSCAHGLSFASPTGPRVSRNPVGPEYEPGAASVAAKRIASAPLSGLG